MPPITFNSHYELPDGSFDKDEQGWYAEYLHIVCEDSIHIKFRQYHDAKGIIRSDYTLEGKVLEVRSGIVWILLNNGRQLQFSLESNKVE